MAETDVRMAWAERRKVQLCRRHTNGPGCSEAFGDFGAFGSNHVVDITNPSPEQIAAGITDDTEHAAAIAEMKRLWARQMERLTGIG